MPIDYRRNKTVLQWEQTTAITASIRKKRIMPSQEHDRSSVVSLRLPDTLLERLHCYLDWMEIHRGDKLSRNQTICQALAQWLDMAEEQGEMTHPDVLRRHFHAAYTSLRNGQNQVEIYRLRRLLKWPPDRFDAIVEQLRAASQVVLDVGDPDDLSDEEQQHSYLVNGQLYRSLSWQD